MQFLGIYEGVNSWMYFSLCVFCGCFEALAYIYMYVGVSSTCVCVCMLCICIKEGGGAVKTVKRGKEKKNISAFPSPHRLP